MITPLCDIRPDYNFLLGYWIGQQKEWWYGIQGVTFIFMGAYNDSYVGYKGYAINESLIADAFWSEYTSENPEPDYKNRKAYEDYSENFVDYMKSNADRVKEMLDEILDDRIVNMTVFKDSVGISDDDNLTVLGFPYWMVNQYWEENIKEEIDFLTPDQAEEDAEKNTLLYWLDNYTADSTVGLYQFAKNLGYDAKEE